MICTDCPHKQHADICDCLCTMTDPYPPNRKRVEAVILPNGKKGLEGELKRVLAKFGQAVSVRVI